MLRERTGRSGDILVNGQGSAWLLLGWASLVAQLVKSPPVMRETWVRSLGWVDPLEKGTATGSSILAWRIPWTDRPWVRQESDATERLSLSLIRLGGPKWKQDQKEG